MQQTGLDAFSGPREVTVRGRAEGIGALRASSLNAISATLLDDDDTHLDTVMHLLKVLVAG